MSVGVHMEGLDQVAQAIRAKLMKSGAAVGTVEIGVVAGGRRGPEKNSLIARVQAAMKRNPWFIDKDTMQAIRFVARGFTSEDASVVASAFKQIGTLLVDGVRQHIGQMKNANGSTFTELTTRYAAFKRRKHGFIHPVLRATGDLMDGLRAVITRTR